jgi:hypothetical protein
MIVYKKKSEITLFSLKKRHKPNLVYLNFIKINKFIKIFLIILLFIKNRNKRNKNSFMYYWKEREFVC